MAGLAARLAVRARVQVEEATDNLYARKRLSKGDRALLDTLHDVAELLDAWWEEWGGKGTGQTEGRARKAR